MGCFLNNLRSRCRAVDAEEFAGHYNVQRFLGKFSFYCLIELGGCFDVKDASQCARPIVERVDEIMKIFESDRISRASRTHKLNTVQRAVWNPLSKFGYRKKLDIRMGNTWVNEKKPNFNLGIAAIYFKSKIELSLNQLVTDHESWVTYSNFKWKQS